MKKGQVLRSLLLNYGNNCSPSQELASLFGNLIFDYAKPVELIKLFSKLTTMLASSLKELERDGLVKRVQYPEIPVRVEYSVTEECAKLVPAFEIIGQWSREKLMLSEEESGERNDEEKGGIV